MRPPRSLSVPVALTLVLATAGCAGPPGPHAAAPAPERAAGRRSDRITADEIRRKSWANAWDLVNELRANWMNVRGVDTFNGPPGDVQVLLDGVRYGGLASLRTLPVVNIEYLQYYDPISASSRWGLDYGHGAIEIVSIAPSPPS